MGWEWDDELQRFVNVPDEPKGPPTVIDDKGREWIKTPSRDQYTGELIPGEYDWKLVSDAPEEPITGLTARPIPGAPGYVEWVDQNGNVVGAPTRMPSETVGQQRGPAQLSETNVPGIYTTQYGDLVNLRDSVPTPITGKLVPTMVDGIYISEDTRQVIDTRDLTKPIIADLQPVPQIRGAYMNMNNGSIVIDPSQAPPDPIAVADFLQDFYATAVQAGDFSADQAARIYQQSYDTFQQQLQAAIEMGRFQQQVEVSAGNWAMAREDTETQRIRAQMEDRRARELAETQRQLDLQRIATERGDLQRRLQGSSVPAGTTFQLPLMGQVPMTGYNMQDVLTQGLGPLPQATTPISSTSPIQFPTLGPLPGVSTPTLPTQPVYTPQQPYQIPKMEDIIGMLPPGLRGGLGL